MGATRFWNSGDGFSILFTFFSSKFLCLNFFGALNGLHPDHAVRSINYPKAALRGSAGRQAQSYDKNDKNRTMIHAYNYTAV